MLQIISDVHLEHCNDQLPEIIPVAPYLALLGDIGHPFHQLYFTFLHHCSEVFDHVLVLAGNHEYHTLYTVDQTNAEISRLCALLQNCTFLNNSCLFLDGALVIGCTLWTHIPPERFSEVCFGYKDFQRIHLTEHGLLTPDAMNHWHADACQYIQQTLEFAAGPVVVLTHHAPLDADFIHPPQFQADICRCCYSSTVPMLNDSRIVGWAFGHTHHPVDCKLDSGLHLLSNPMGYTHERLERVPKFLTW